MLFAPGKDSKPAKVVLSETFDSVSRKLKMPSLKPTYSTLPGPHSKGQISWKSVLNLKWPDTLRYLHVT